MKSKIIKILLLICISVALTGCSFQLPDFSEIFNSISFFDDTSILKVTFFDVGQGDCALLECDNEYMLIDGGPKNSVTKVVNYLNDNSIKRLKYLAISHMHDDHINGLPYILRALDNVDNVISNENLKTGKNNSNDIEQELNYKKKNIIIPKKGKEYNLGEAKIEVLSNTKEYENDSLVLLVKHGDNSFLFTGDIENKSTKTIWDEWDNNARLTVLKVAHHGAEKHTGYQFLNVLRPYYAVISAGDMKHPHSETIDILEQSGIPSKNIFVTKNCGNVTIVSNRESVEVYVEK